MNILDRIITIKISLALAALLGTALVSAGITYTIINIYPKSTCIEQSSQQIIIPPQKPSEPYKPIPSHDGRKF